MRQAIVAATCALALAATSGACASGSVVPGAATPGPSPSTPSEVRTDAPTDGRVVRVTDGDTIEVSHAGEVQRVRLIGINAPEDGECFSDRATQLLRELVDDREVQLVRDRSDRDRYGRLLRYVHADGVDVNLELVRRGAALARPYPPDTGRADEFEQAQATARRSARGMWSAEDGCMATAGTGAGLELAVHADAPGDDGDNLNGEWVAIRNDGTEPVDLSGWGIKDESASHRYTFPDGVRLDVDQILVVRSGCGQDTQLERFWCTSGSAIWNNAGDTAFLLDPRGRIVTTHAY